MATARAVQAPLVEPASLKNLDPPMVQPIWPAGFPLHEDSPRLLSDFSLGERNMRQVAPLSPDVPHQYFTQRGVIHS